MKLTIRVRDTLGIRDADVVLETGEVVEVVGPNASGKTSLAVAAQAVLTHDANPLHLSAAVSKRAYPYEESDEAQVTLTYEDFEPEFGDTLIEHEVVWWPRSSKITAPGTVLPISGGEAVGTVDFRTRRSGRDQATRIQDPLLPPLDQMLKQVEARLKVDLPPEDLRGVLKDHPGARLGEGGGLLPGPGALHEDRMARHHRSRGVGDGDRRQLAAGRVARRP